MYDLCGNTVTLTGLLVNKRFKELGTGRSVLSLYVRSKDSRGSFYNIPVDFWGKSGVDLNKQLVELLPNVDDGDKIPERDTLTLTIDGELRQQSWLNKDGKQERRFLINGNKCKVEKK